MANYYPSNYQSYYKESNPYLDHTAYTNNTYNIAQSQIQERSVRAITYSTPTRNPSQRIFGSSPSQRSVVQPMVVQPTQLNFQQSSPLTIQNQYYTQSVQPIYRIYNQPATVYKQPEVQTSVVHEIEHVPTIHEIHHINRPINVISMDEIEGPWRGKKILLEKQLLELQLMMKRGPNKQIEVKEIVVEDEAKIRQLQAEIERLHGISNENDEEIASLEEQVQEAEYNIDNAEESAAAQIEEQNQELMKWKKKFSDLNKKYHDIEEDITMTEAQIESIQKRKLVTTTSSSIKTTAQRQGQRRESEIRRSNYSNRNN